MAIGDVVSAHTNILNGLFLTIQPSGSAQWGIQNLYVPAGVECEFYRTDGTNDILLFSLTDTIQFSQPFNPTNTIYFKLKNVSGSSAYLGYDAKISKV